ncbi:MAG: tetratricopeptide repeat protein, partial [Methanobacteriota archaeon]
MINKRGEIKITDFGLAKLRGSSTITMPGAQLGTAAYMAPEVIQGEEADHRSDIFSFGVLLYKMLTRKSPFKGENDQAVMFSIVYEKPQPIIKLRQDVPQPLMDLVYRMLEKEPEDRVQDIQEVLTILNDIHSGKTTVTSKPFFSRITGRLPNTARPIFITSLVALLFIAIVVVRIILSPTHPAFKERDWILIANFDNQTNEEIFNRSLDKAFLISIEQSRYVNVFPPDRIRSVLQRMKRSDVQFIDKEIGCEIALREGITAVLVPTITRLENAYSLTAEIINPVNGKLLASEITYANSREEVLDALDELTRRIRKRLGEALAAISERSRPLRQVTTSSLEALKYYSVAYDHLRRAEYEEARQFLESALEKDSTFTVAKATLGRLHFDQSPYEEGFDREKGIQLLKEAVEEIEHLTEREKYPILAWYAQAVEKDLPKAIRYAKELVTLYPDLSTAHNTLGYLYSLTGRYQEAIKEYQQAIRLDPYLMIAYNNLSITYMFQLGSEIDSARVWC